MTNAVKEPGILGAGIPKLGEWCKVMSPGAVPWSLSMHYSTPWYCGNDCTALSVLPKRAWGNLKVVWVAVLCQSPFGGVLRLIPLVKKNQTKHIPDAALIFCSSVKDVEKIELE